MAVGFRTGLQAKLMAIIGTESKFNKVVYNTSGIPSTSAELIAPSTVIVNETTGQVSNDTRIGGATGFNFGLTNWRFELKLEFPCEVEVNDFLTDQLGNLNFKVDDTLVGVVPSGDFQVTHPPRQGSHNGTKLIVGLIVNTRR